MSQRLFFSMSVGLVAAVLAVSCAPKKQTSNTTLSSRVQTPTNDSQYLLAECSRISHASFGLVGQISTYYSYGQLNPSYLNINFTQMPAAVLTSTSTLQVFRWSERVVGQKQVNSIPVTMYFMQKGTGAVSNPNGSNVISKSALETLISQNSLGASGITVANFFQRHYVVLTGMDTQWDAALFSVSSNGAVASSGSALLPAFYANPNAYAQANASTELQSLHPNYSYRSSNASENEYFQLTEQICSGFFGSVRVPASIGSETVLTPPAVIEPQGLVATAFEYFNRALALFMSIF